MRLTARCFGKLNMTGMVGHPHLIGIFVEIQIVLVIPVYTRLRVRVRGGRRLLGM